MVPCKECGVANMADSKYCRECGVVLDPLSNAVRHEENQKLIESGRRKFGEGKLDDALNMALTVLENDPHSVDGLALAGDCYESQGDYGSALEHFTKIVRVKPDSQLDKIRVSRLEKIVSGDSVVVQEPQGSRYALGAAVAATLLIVSSAAALVLATRPNSVEEPLQLAENSGITAIPFSYSPTPVPTSTGNLPIQPTDSGAAGNSGNFDQGVERENRRPVSEIIGEASQINNNAALDSPSYIDPTLPRKIDPYTAGNEPVTIELPNGPGAGQSLDPEPNPVTAANIDEDKPNSVIEIGPANGEASQQEDVAQGSEPAGPNAAEAETLIQVARQEFILQNFAKAADAYLKALQAGASPGSTNQRLAQCYEKLNRYEEAINAYERAITAYEQLDPDNTRVQTAIASCKQALKILRSK